MNNRITLHSFQPNRPDTAGVVSWIHFGDLHMTSQASKMILICRRWSRSSTPCSPIRSALCTCLEMWLSMGF